jgi:hypothetical protein
VVSRDFFADKILTGAKKNDGHAEVVDDPALGERADYELQQ